MKSPTINGNFTITDEHEPWGRVICARGELDITAVPELRAHLGQAVDAGTHRLLLDFDAVTFIDSVSLAAIVAAERRMGPEGRLVIATGHEYVLLILEAGGLDDVVEVFATRDEAEAALLE